MNNPFNSSLSLPVVAAPMFLISGPKLVTECCKTKQVWRGIWYEGGSVWRESNCTSYKSAPGVDGLICVAAGAGGHAGTLNPLPFIAEMRSFFDGTILLSGCLSTGRDVASAMQMGADLAYMGTRFINTVESRADDDYKQMIVESGTSSIVYTAAVSGVPANFLRPSLEMMGITKEMWDVKNKVDFGEELDSEAKAWKSIWSAGQGVTTIDNVLPVSELVAQIKSEFTEAIEAQATLLKTFAW